MIGIFDSGVGGLSVLQELRKIAPRADVLYFGDSANAPYGNKPPSEVTSLTYNGIKFLVENGASEIISACNSVSVSIILPMFDLLELSANNVVEMVGPVVDDFKTNNYGKTLLVATTVTINSELYQNAFRLIDQTIDTLAIPDLAGAIENGANSTSIKNIIAQALNQVNLGNYQTIILGCTHYPLVIEEFSQVINSYISSHVIYNTNETRVESGLSTNTNESKRDSENVICLYNPAVAVARKVIQKFDINGSGNTVFRFSKETTQNQVLIQEF